MASVIFVSPKEAGSDMEKAYPEAAAFLIVKPGNDPMDFKAYPFSRDQLAGVIAKLTSACRAVIPPSLTRVVTAVPCVE